MNPGALTRVWTLGCAASLCAWSATIAPGTAKLPAFPRQAAALYLAAHQPQPPRLTSHPDPPSPRALAAAERILRHLADAHGSGATQTRQRALAAMVLGTGEAEDGQLAAAQHDLTEAALWPPIHDAAVAELVWACARANDDAGVLSAAATLQEEPRDPFYRRVAYAAARSAVKQQDWPAVRVWTRSLPRSAETLWMRAQAATASGDPKLAAELERDLVYHYPASSQARLAAGPWQAALARRPVLSPTWQLIAAQARAWAAAGQARTAAAAWEQAEQLAPAGLRPRLEADEARAWRAAGDSERAHALAQSLLSTPEEPQALEIEVELGRRQNDPAALAPLVDRLGQKFPHSFWYERALHEAGDEAVLANDPDLVLSYFGRLAARFPHSGYAPAAVWHVAWTAYRRRRPDTGAWLERYLRDFPHDLEAPDALYWRGVWAQQHHQPLLAQACFEADVIRFPETYFGLQARIRYRPGHALSYRRWPTWLRPFGTPEPAPRARPIEAGARTAVVRAQWLESADLRDPAATILGNALANTPSADALQLARRLASLDAARNDWFGELAAMLHALPHYLALAPNRLPASDWRHLYPMPMGGDIRAAAVHFGLSRNLLLGVIRQESSFDASSISSARAIGIMQLELATARGRLSSLPPRWRELAGDGRLGATDLLNPSLNIALGAAELHALIEQFHDSVDVLIGYNAGALRVPQWRSAYAAKDPNEFIECIPFSQTRDYVESVLRNAAIYRRIYGP